MIEILLSIKHEWAIRIYRGEKDIEYRKSSPTVETYGQPIKVYLYESGTGKVTGEMLVTSIKVYDASDCYEEKGNGCVDFERKRRRRHSPLCETRNNSTILEGITKTRNQKKINQKGKIKCSYRKKTSFTSLKTRKNTHLSNAPLRSTASNNTRHLSRRTTRTSV